MDTWAKSGLPLLNPLEPQFPLHQPSSDSGLSSGNAFIRNEGNFLTDPCRDENLGYCYKIKGIVCIPASVYSWASCMLANNFFSQSFIFTFLLKTAKESFLLVEKNGISFMKNLGVHIMCHGKVNTAAKKKNY